MPNGLGTMSYIRWRCTRNMSHCLPLNNIYTENPWQVLYIPSIGVYYVQMLKWIVMNIFYGTYFLEHIECWSHCANTWSQQERNGGLLLVANLEKYQSFMVIKSIGIRLWSAKQTDINTVVNNIIGDVMGSRNRKNIERTSSDDPARITDLSD